MTTMTDNELSLAADLARASSAAQQIPAPAFEPVDNDSAYRIQFKVLELRGDTIRGWKVGSKSTEGPAQGAPLPARAVLNSPASLDRKDFPVLGLGFDEPCFAGQRYSPAVVLSDSTGHQPTVGEISIGSRLRAGDI